MSIDRMAELLVTQATQVAIVGFAVWILFLLFARNRPHLAHALWALVLIKCLTPAVALSPFGFFQGPSLQEASSTAILVTKPESSTPEIPAKSALDTPQAAPEFTLTNSLPTILRLTSSGSQGATLSHRLNPSVLLLLIWGVGTCIAAYNMTAKLVNFSREIRSQVAATPDWLNDIVERQTRVIGLRRIPSLMVVDSLVGPAVIGFLNPTIVLPKSLLDKTQQHAAYRVRRDVELLIAHELVHIRRGDLIWSVVQAVAVCCWWFHPAVRLANIMVSRESERSCDEETIASLKCCPTGYARALLAVINRRNELSVPRPLPGIRPVDITVSRMERIMRLETGSHKRGPWWVSVIVVVGTLVVLPHRDYANGQEPQKQLGAREDMINHKKSGSNRQAENGDAKSSTAQWKGFDIGRLTTKPPTVYLLDDGDVLGVSVPKILHRPGEQLFFPITVMRNGTISLPLLKPISVAGLSTAEARARVEDAYEKSNVLASRPNALVTVIKMRRRNVLVWRPDGERRSNPQLLSLKGTGADVLHALSESGGMLDKPLKSVRIVRASNLKGFDLDHLLEKIESDEVKSELLIYTEKGRLQLDESVSVLLDDGDLLVLVPE